MQGTAVTAQVCATSGQPDIGVVGLEGFCRVIKEVHSATGLPVLADADTGFGEEEMMTKTTLESAPGR